ncbi:putative dynein light chain roadblock-type 2 [Blattamonas nauphoetae]|uniref:Dynein light chain roadblock-type 2 n=1 Tax=Blattamonas nauphoetae TaxID=2049346 RepID=A0ABQ9X8N4_9EUKA|nr:putative dynein light chain roadblock-type 2 [Blattamonas nauphoetae]
MASAKPAEPQQPPSEIETTLTRMSQHPGVLGLLIATKDCKRTKIVAIDEESPLLLQKDEYASLCTSISGQALSVIRDIDPADKLLFMRIRTKKHEIIIAPEDDFTVICVQDPNTAS